jgi:hypothetical protein
MTRLQLPDCDKPENLLTQIRIEECTYDALESLADVVTEDAGNFSHKQETIIFNVIAKLQCAIRKV